MNYLNVFLMTPQNGQGGGGFATLLPLLVIIVIFYFFFIRPQIRKNQEMRKFRESLQKGDKIVTIGGIHGKIIEVSETWFIIETEGQGRLKIERSAVSMNNVSSESLGQR
jgi:preprotein translocase subunit YajC